MCDNRISCVNCVVSAGATGFSSAAGGATSGGCSAILVKIPLVLVADCDRKYTYLQRMALPFDLSHDHRERSQRCWVALPVANGAAVRAIHRACWPPTAIVVMSTLDRRRCRLACATMTNVNGPSAADWRCQLRMALPPGRLHHGCGLPTAVVVVCTFGRRCCRVAFRTTIDIVKKPALLVSTASCGWRCRSSEYTVGVGRQLRL